jgi:hypothetical protein
MRRTTGQFVARRVDVGNLHPAQAVLGMIGHDEDLALVHATGERVVGSRRPTRQSVARMPTRRTRRTITDVIPTAATPTGIDGTATRARRTVAGMAADRMALAVAGIPTTTVAGKTLIGTRAAAATAAEAGQTAAFVIDGVTLYEEPSHRRCLLFL